MFIIDFVKRIAKSIGRKNVEDEINTAKDEIDNQTIPTIKQLMKEFPSIPRFKSETYTLYNKAIVSGTGIRVKGDMFDVILLTLTNVGSIADFVSNYVSTKLETEINQSSVTVTDAQVFQLLDSITFAARYTRRLQDIILRTESNVMMDKNSSQELKGVRQADIDYIVKYRDSYIKTLKMLQTPVSKIKELINNIPDIVVSDLKSSTTLSVQGNDKVDPLGFGRDLVVSPLNPIWLIGSWSSTRQHEKYTAAKEEATVIKMRIARLKAQYEEKPDPKLAAIIEKREGQVDLLRAKIEKYEKEVNGE